MDWLAGLVGLSFVSAVTPGPNNLLLWASGAQFGFLASVRHVLGTALGIGAMAVVAAAGIAELLGALPALGLALRVVASAYLLYLAWRIAGATALQRRSIARPLGVIGAAGFQLLNPKAWIFVFGAVTTFEPPDVAPTTGILLVAGTMALVVIPASSLWAGAGGVIGQLFHDGRAARIVSLALALLLSASVLSIWA